MRKIQTTVTIIILSTVALLTMGWQGKEGTTIFKVSTESQLERCVGTSGPRVCLIEAGVYTVDELTIDKPYLHLTGKGAQGSVVLQGNGSGGKSAVNVDADYVTIEHVTILARSNGEGSRSLSVADRDNNVTGININHISTGLSGDEDVIFWYDTTDVIYRNSLSALSLQPDSKGPLLGRVGHGGGGYLIKNNIFAFHRQRMPRIRADRVINVVGNYITGHTGGSEPSQVTEGSPVNYYGNYIEVDASHYIEADDSRVYIDKTNMMSNGKTGASIATNGSRGSLVNLPHESRLYQTDTLVGEDLKDYLMETAGNQLQVDCEGRIVKRSDPFTDHIKDAIRRGDVLKTSETSYLDVSPITELPCDDDDNDGIPDGLDVYANPWQTVGGKPALYAYLDGDLSEGRSDPTATITPRATREPTETPRATITPQSTPTAIPTIEPPADPEIGIIQSLTTIRDELTKLIEYLSK